MDERIDECCDFSHVLSHVSDYVLFFVKNICSPQTSLVDFP